MRESQGKAAKRRPATAAIAIRTSSQASLLAVAKIECVEPEPSWLEDDSDPAAVDAQILHEFFTAWPAVAERLREELTRICGVDLTQVAGLNMLGVLILISEIDVDMSRWRNEKAFSSWLGLCPFKRQSPTFLLAGRFFPPQPSATR